MNNLQLKFNNARKNLNKEFETVSFQTTIQNSGIFTEIIYENNIISVGFYKCDIQQPTNNDYLNSMLTAIANYDLALLD